MEKALQASKKHTSCKCLKSHCSSKYCPCYKQGNSCSAICGCFACWNKNQQYVPTEAHGPQHVQGEQQQYINSTQEFGQKQPELSTPIENFKQLSHLSAKSDDPLKKATERADQMRKLNKKAKLDIRRENALRIQNSNNSNFAREQIDLRVLLINVRGISSKIKQDTLRYFIKHHQAEIIGLTETHLKENFRIKNMSQLQTKPHSKGGVWSAVGGSRQIKNLKFINNSITYQSIAFFSTPIHIIACYLSPIGEDAPQVKVSLQHIKAMVSNILRNHKHSKIIVQGDFNSRWIGEVQEFLGKVNLFPVFDRAEPTHKQGNVLDQVFTNLEAISKNITPVEFSDHYALEVKLRFQKTEKDLDLRQIPTYTSQKDIRSHAMSQETKEEILKNPDVLYRPLKEVYEQKLTKKKKIRSWYRAPPKWFLYQETHGGTDNKTLRDKEWEQLMEKINQAFKEQDMKYFHKLVNQATQLKKQGTPIKGLILSGAHCFDEELVQKEVCTYFSQLYKNYKPLSMDTGDDEQTSKLFSIQDVLDAIGQTNFSKGIGQDGFDGRILEDMEVRELVAKFILNSLNSRNIPSHFCDGRLILLSKQRGHEVVPIEETRPIVINSHIYKICEKVIYNKIKSSNSCLLRTGPYQQGFKTNGSTHFNIAKVLNEILQQSKRRKKQSAFIFVDLRKAYDSLDRQKLIQILNHRASTPEEKCIVNLIKQLTSTNRIWYGFESFLAEKGVIQGGVLSPFLFNVYLEDVISRNPVLNKLLIEKKLLAFADDLMIKVNSKREFKEVVEALELMNESHGLQLNKEKTVFLTKNIEFKDDTILYGIAKVQQTKYLGSTISLKRDEIIKNAKNQIHQKLFAFKARIRINEPKIQEALFTSYLRSLMIYYLTPLVATHLIKPNQVQGLETVIRRKMLQLPNDIKSSVVQNVSMSHRNDTSKVVSRLAERVELKATLQPTIVGILRERCTSNDVGLRHNPLYIQRETMNLMMAITQGRTCLHFGKIHYCNTISLNIYLILSTKFPLPIFCSHVFASNSRNA